MLTLDPAKCGLRPLHGLPAGPSPQGGAPSARPRPHDAIAKVQWWLLAPIRSAHVEIIAQGLKAGRDGHGAEMCPHAAGTRDADMWHLGREAA